uniref:Uncharacterized protein n=1 Tax=Meloidogyne incognita TaxID=6306 RepID=A0A914MGG9_MELIC
MIKALVRNLEESSEDREGDNIIAKGNKLVQEGKRLIEEGNKIKKKNISKKLLQDICSCVKPGSFMYESNSEPESIATSSQVLVQKKKYTFVWELDNWVFLGKYHSQFLQIWDKLQRPLNLLLRNLFGISDFKSFNFTNILDVPTLENIGFRMPHSSSNVEHGTLNTSSNLRYMTEKLKQIQALYKYFKKLSLFEDNSENSR